MIEYRIKPVTRYVVTKYVREENVGSCQSIGIYDQVDVAYGVAYALADYDRQRLGLPLNTPDIIFPDPIAGATHDV